MVTDPRKAAQQKNDARVSMPAHRRLRIGLFPCDSTVNLYAQRLRANLAQLGEVVPVGSPGQRVVRAFAKEPAFDVIIVGWLENALVSGRGGISYSGLAKMVAQICVLRAQSRRVIYVRHNRYPHSAKPGAARLMAGVLDQLERFFDLTLTHSPAEVGSSTTYCPHPLYDLTRHESPLPGELDLQPGYYVVFGRIAPYKNIEALIRAFPEQRRLVVAGVADDAAYVERLQGLRRPNIIIAPGYLDEAQAQTILRRAAGVVICHSAENVIVTGSFFYAMSLCRPVLAVATPFLSAIQPQVGSRALQLAPDIEGLGALLAGADSTPPPTAAEWSAVRAAFSDETICQQLSQVFTRLGLYNALGQRTGAEQTAEVVQ